MPDLKTILEELLRDHARLSARGQRDRVAETPEKWNKYLEELDKLTAETLAKIEGMIPEKKKTLPTPEPKSVVLKNYINQGYNQAIEDMKANLGGENG